MLHVKLSDGSDGLPKGWPVECVQCPDGEALRPGFHKLMTPEQLTAAQAKLRAAYDAGEPARQALARLPATEQAIKTERDRRIQSGGYQAFGAWFHSDTFSRTQQMGLVMMGANIPPGLKWKTMDGSFVEMTQGLAASVYAAAAAQDIATFAAAEAALARLHADPVAFDLAAVQWPAVYGD